MSYTKRQFIVDAFAESGISDTESDIQPGEFQVILRRMDSLMARWNAAGIGCRYPLPDSPEDSSLDTETNVIDEANDAIILNTALIVGRVFRKPLSRDQKVEAKDAKNALIKFLSYVPQQSYSSLTPKGSGWKTWRDYGRDPFYQENNCNDRC